MKLYKLTTQDFKTSAGYSNECKWGEGVTHQGTGKGDLCSPAFIHAYTSPLLAVLLNPIHANLTNPILWEAEGSVVKSDRGLKVGCLSLTTVRQITVPDISTTQRVAFAIFCVKASGSINSIWNNWADNWLSGKDRSIRAARAAASAAYAAASAARAAAYAADAAEAAARAAASAARAAAYAADAAASAARAAAYAADAADAAAYIKLIKIAEEAMKYGGDFEMNKPSLKRVAIYLSARELEFLAVTAQESKDKYVRIEWENGNVWHQVWVGEPNDVELQKLPLFHCDLEQL